MDEERNRKIKVFYSYVQEDARLQQRLESHLRALKHNEIIDDWSQRNISAGSEWSKEVSNRLADADIILLLVSPGFIASEYCYGIEVQLAMEKHRKNQAVVIPVLLRPTHLEDAPFNKLRVLPSNSRPVTSWRNYDEAFTDITQGIQTIVKELKNIKKEALESEDKQQSSRGEKGSIDLEAVSNKFAGKRILIVEDNPTVNELLWDAFRLFGLGCKLSFTDNGNSALSFIQEYQPDLILLDLMMPYLGGLEVIKRLRQEGNGTPVLIMSAGTINYILEGITLGANEFLQKPFLLKKLLSYMLYLLYGELLEIKMPADMIIK